MNNLSIKGMFIALEGIDGAGKSTLAVKLTDFLRNAGYSVVNCNRAYYKQTKELLNIARTLENPAPNIIALAYALDYFMQMELIIFPAVKRGDIVISDRYIFSSIAYNTAFGLDRAWNNIVYKSSLIPNKVFYLDIAPEVAFRRRPDQDPLSRAINQDFISYQQNVRKVYLDLSVEYDFIVLDATKSLESLMMQITNALNIAYN